MAVPPALRYTLLRLTLLLAALVLFFGLGFRGFWLLVLAVLMSGIVSYFLLTGPRAAMAERLGTRLGGISRRIDESTRAEDDDRPGDQRAAGDEREGRQGRNEPDGPGGPQRNV